MMSRNAPNILSWSPKMNRHLRATSNLSPPTGAMFPKKVPRLASILPVSSMRRVFVAYSSAPMSVPTLMASQSRACSAQRTALSPRSFPSTGFETIDASLKVEEETLPFYDPKIFYPVRIGEVFRNRYQAVAKLGYGTSSTTWLCHDLV
jgi:hypothetical protein